MHRNMVEADNIFFYVPQKKKIAIRYETYGIFRNFQKKEKNNLVLSWINP